MRLGRISFFLALSLFLCSCGPSQSPGDESTPRELRELNQKIIDDPNNAAHYVERAKYYFEKEKNKNAAIGDMDKAVQLEPDNVEYILTLSDFYFAANRTRNTRDLLLRAISKDQKNSEALLKLGELYYLVKNYDSAIVYLNKCIKVNEDNPSAYFQKGMTLKERGVPGDTAQAVNNFQRAVELNPQHYDALLQLGEIYASIKDPLAIEYYNSALKIRPNSTEVYYHVGMFYQNTGQLDQAIEVYNEILKREPNHAFAIYNLGYIEMVFKENYKAARPYFDRAYQADPEYANAVYMRGVCSEKLGDKKAAAADYNTALILDPQHKLSLEGLKRLKEMK
ncbi:MAG: tetratricopeptide repeat protein [Bacteroidota bacterium]